MTESLIIRGFVAGTCVALVGAIIVWHKTGGRSNADKVWARELLDHWKEQENTGNQIQR